jgi:hypothetical protein
MGRVEMFEKDETQTLHGRFTGYDQWKQNFL